MAARKAARSRGKSASKTSMKKTASARAGRKPAIPARPRRSTLPLQEAKIEIERRGRGKPLLLLHGEDTYEPTLPLIDELARRFEVIMPWMPGYGRSTLPESVHGIEDISYLWLDLLDRLNLKNVAVMGFSVGGWAAAEMATKNCGRLSRLVLVDPVGAKFGGPFDRDIADIYFNSFDKVRAMKFADPAKDPRDLTRLGHDEAFRVARDREVTAKLCWEPYFHNPSLKYRLNPATCRMSSNRRRSGAPSPAFYADANGSERRRYFFFPFFLPARVASMSSALRALAIIPGVSLP
jgi:pimeloyl-ACP methyl ester carboxylesterase